MMNRVLKFAYCISVAVWIFGVINLFAVPAHAYVDPGSGLLALQIIGSTLAGAMFLIRKRIRDMFGFFSKKPREATKPVEPR
jgi:hypothetical protein